MKKQFITWANRENRITDKDRYNRYSEDWRFQHKLIWEIPGVTIAIIAGILTVSFSFLGLLPRLVLLSLGTVLIFGLAVAVFKHRFSADLRTNFLEEIGQDKDLFPIRSDKGLEYLNRKRKEEGKKEIRFGRMIKWRSEVFLIGFMFLAFGVLLFLTSYTFFEICCGWQPIESQGKNISSAESSLLHPVTNSVLTK
ncbi:MAG: hypothetical protein ACRD47_08365 [Nitrososphaeraceae archaeon]